MIAAGFIQIVQTSTGQQLITTTGPSAGVPQTIQVTPRPAVTSAQTTPLGKEGNQHYTSLYVKN